MRPNLNQSLLGLKLARGFVKLFLHCCNKTQILQLLLKIFPPLNQREELNICLAEVQSKSFFSHFKNLSGNIAMKWMPKITSMPFFHTRILCSLEGLTMLCWIWIVPIRLTGYIWIFCSVGITSFNTTFYFGFEFFQKKKNNTMHGHWRMSSILMVEFLIFQWLQLTAIWPW